MFEVCVSEKESARGVVCACSEEGRVHTECISKCDRIQGSQRDQLEQQATAV